MVREEKQVQISPPDFFRSRPDQFGSRIEGSKGLAHVLRIIENHHANDNPGDVFLVFDFDKTITNGFNLPTVNGSERVRGKQTTVDAINDSKFAKFILTARCPKVITLETIRNDKTFQVINSRNNFPLDVPKEIFTFENGGADTTSASQSPVLVHDGHLYASGYQKARGIAHIVRTAHQKPKYVYFFDDNVQNAYEVQRDVPSLTGMEVGAVWGVWWDLYKEEFDEKTIKPATPGTDFVYSKFKGEFIYKDALQAYGLSTEECNERFAMYNEATPVKSQTVSVPPLSTNTKKLDMNKFGFLDNQLKSSKS